MQSVTFDMKNQDEPAFILPQEFWTPNCEVFASLSNLWSDNTETKG